MPTIQQLIRKPRTQKTYREKARHMQACPQMRGNATVIRAFVPLANMFGYVSQLRSMSQGRAMYTMQFAHYAEVPRNVADEVKAKYA